MAMESPADSAPLKFPMESPTDSAPRKFPPERKWNFLHGIEGNALPVLPLGNFPDRCSHDRAQRKPKRVRVVPRIKAVCSGRNGSAARMP